MNKRELYYLLSPKLRRIFRRLYYYPSDLLDNILGRRDKLIPPKGKIFIGHGDFKIQGDRLLNQLISYANLQPDQRVLDVGCGIGRLAVPLTKYLNHKGSYEGFDIVKSGIKWCKKNISNSYPNFNFKHIDLKNDLYNLSTDKEAKNFIFPYNDNEFDLVFLFSVFTHMTPLDVDNYLKQINRVLKHNGTCFVTFFILNEESKSLMDNYNGLKFNYNMGDYVLLDKKVREANVAYKEDFLNHLIFNNNFIIDKIFYGWWCGRKREKCLDYQDTIILRKVANRKFN
ncbi:MAG: class I SAM-dependent methyltransferase [Thiohalospira sp.]